MATDLWGEGDTDPLDHVELARWADVAVVAPATGNLLGKAAHGIADDIVTTLLLAWEGPLVLAPAMNDVMWRHPATRANLALLQERGARVVPPGTGWLACGVEAEGRMAEPDEIFAAVSEAAAGVVAAAAPDAESPWRGVRVVVTAGPTREPIDAIRFISNQSSGFFGFAIAAEAARRGARVVLIHGPVDLPTPPGMEKVVGVETAAQLADAVRDELGDGVRCLIMAAAVADFAPRVVASGKVKKQSLGTAWNLEMTRTVDILAEIVPGQDKRGMTVVGFALETEDVLARAEEKMRAKDMDFIVANDPTAEDGAFGDGRHRVRLLGDAEGLIWDSGPADKATLAAGLLDQLGPRLKSCDADGGDRA